MLLGKRSIVVTYHLLNCTQRCTNPNLIRNEISIKLFFLSWYLIPYLLYCFLGPRKSVPRRHLDRCFRAVIVSNRQAHIHINHATHDI